MKAIGIDHTSVGVADSDPGILMDPGLLVTMTKM